jgi:hypothetical protein
MEEPPPPPLPSRFGRLLHYKDGETLKKRPLEFSRKWVARVTREGTITVTDARDFPLGTVEHARFHDLIAYIERLRKREYAYLHPSSTKLWAGVGVFDHMEFIAFTLAGVCIDQLCGLVNGIKLIHDGHSDLGYTVEVNDFYPAVQPIDWKPFLHGHQCIVTVFDATARDRRDRCRAAAMVMMSYKLERHIKWPQVRQQVARIMWEKRTDSCWDTAVAEGENKRIKDE